MQGAELKATQKEIIGAWERGVWQLGHEVLLEEMTSEQRLDEQGEGHVIVEGKQTASRAAQDYADLACLSPQLTHHLHPQWEQQCGRQSSLTHNKPLGESTVTTLGEGPSYPLNNSCLSPTHLRPLLAR